MQAGSRAHPKAETNRRFTLLEDQRLKELVAQFGARRWQAIAQHMPGRTGRQCRDRYSNYLSPAFYNVKWTAEDDELLLQKHEEFGPQWTKLMSFFPGKTANNIKNRWNYSVSRLKEQREQRMVEGKPYVPPERKGEVRPVRELLPPISSLIDSIGDWRLAV